MQEKQATGIDTRMMLPVYAAVYSILCQVFLPWISVPSLKYMQMPVSYPVFRMGQCLQNLQSWFSSGGKIVFSPMMTEEFPPAPITAGQMEALRGVTLGLQILAGLLIAVMIFCAVSVLVRRDRSRKTVKIGFSLGVILGILEFILAVTANVLLNRRTGRENSFLNLTLYSGVQMTSWAYAQMLISLAVCCFADRLLDVRRETGAQKYVERTVKEDRHLGKRTVLCLVLIAVAIPLVIFFGIFFLNDRSNVFIGLCIVCLAMLPFAMVFEDRKPQARELLLIAVMAGIGVVGRVAFFMLPQFKPVTAVVIIAGIGLGAEAGFLTGAVSGFVSNFFFGQGPWTPWQMFAYGIIGFLAGLLFARRGNRKCARTKKQQRLHLLAVCTYGGLATFFIYGVIMDFSSAIALTQAFSWKVFVAKMLSGAPFNLIHGLSTIVFLLVLAGPMERKLDRIKKKYGILEV